MCRSTLPDARGVLVVLVLLAVLPALFIARAFSDSIDSRLSYNVVGGDAAVGSSNNSSWSGPRWVTANLTSLPALAWHKAVVVERDAAESLCAIGGDSRDAYCYPLDALGAPENAGGGLAYSLAVPLRYHATAVISNYTYVLGGYVRVSNSLKGDVYCVPPNAQGDVAPTNVMPRPIDQHAAVAVGNRIYVIGGYVGPGSYLPDVWSTDITSNCSPPNSLTWDKRSSLLTGLAGHAAASVVLDNGARFIYTVGGLTGRSGSGSVPTNTVQFTQVLSNGVLSNWVNLGPVRGTLGNQPVTMPGAWLLTVAVSGRYLYVMGGSTSIYAEDNSATNTVYRARIQDDGTLQWLPLAASLPIPLHSHASAVSRRGNLYVVGGISSTGRQNKVYYTPLLDFEKRIEPPRGPVTYGDTVNYTLTLTSLGVRDFMSLTITDTVQTPVSATFIFPNLPSDCRQYSSNTVTCTIPSLAITGTKELTYQVSISLPTTILSSTPSPFQSPHQETEQDNVCSPSKPNCPKQADLSIRKDASSDLAMRGGILIYTLVVSNAGPSDAQGVIVTDTLPDGLTLFSATPPQLSGPNPLVWNLDLAAGQVQHIQVTATIAPTSTGILCNRAGVFSDEIDIDPFPLNNLDEKCVAVDRLTDLETKKYGHMGPVFCGDLLTYTLWVKNNGPSDARKVVITDILPAGLSFYSSVPTPTNGLGLLTWQTDTLAASGVWTITVVAKANASARGILVNTVCSTNVVSDTNSSNNCAQERTLSQVPVVNKAKVCEGSLWCQESNTVILSSCDVYLPIVFKAN